MQDPLHCLSLEKWTNLQNSFKLDLPRSFMAHNLLEIQKRWLQQGIQYNFVVYCPYGDVASGMVAIFEKAGFNEMTIQCPRDDTKKLENAIKKTKIINWNKINIISAAPEHILNFLEKILTDVNMKIKIVPSVQFVLDKTLSAFIGMRLPPEITFGLLSSEHIDFVDSVWPHRYLNSKWFFEKLINSNSGYGLFKDNALIAWVFIFDIGALGHLYVVEQHRRKGYAEIIIKLVYNRILEEGGDVFAYVLKDNVKSCNLFNKLGFRTINDASWVYFNKLE